VFVDGWHGDGSNLNLPTTLDDASVCEEIGYDLG
jgi:hypothetical protein